MWMNKYQTTVRAVYSIAIADICTPGNPREVTEGIILELYKKVF